MNADEIFVDWVDLRQDHAYTHAMRQSGELYPGHPEFIGGVRATGKEIEAVTEDGKVFYLLASNTGDKCGFKTLPGRREGSHSTSVLLHSDGRNVRISGNVGRLDRPEIGRAHV